MPRRQHGNQRWHVRGCSLTEANAKSFTPSLEGDADISDTRINKNATSVAEGGNLNETKITFSSGGSISEAGTLGAKGTDIPSNGR